MGESTQRHRHLFNREVNLVFEVERTDFGINLTCERWLPRKLFIPDEVWKACVVHPIHGRVTDARHLLWNWNAGGDYWLILSIEKLDDLNRGSKTVHKIPCATWFEILATDI